MMAIARIMDSLDKFLDPANWQTAWEHVAENHGAAGVDGETIEHFARIWKDAGDECRRAYSSALSHWNKCKDCSIGLSSW